MVHISIVVCCTAFVLSTFADDEAADTELVNAVGSTAFMVNGDRAFAGGFIPNFPKMSDRGKTYLEEWKQIRKKVPPLFFDSFSPIFFKDYTWQIFESFVALDNFSEMDDRGMMMGLRTVFVDAAVRRAIAAGTKQVVFLGSGLDTKALRLHTHDVTTFEVDQKPVLSYKLKELAEAGYPVYPAKTIMGNYFEIDLFEELKKAGMDLTAPTLFVWEGNQMYIPLDLTKSLLTKLFKTVPNSEVMFDSIAAEGDELFEAVVKAMASLDLAVRSSMRLTLSPAA